MEKKCYEAPEVMVVQLTQCTIIATSGQQGGGNIEDFTRERNPYDDMNNW
jgi:hypothetical protein